MKKILSLDGGGIRGVISIEILAKIERQLRKLHCKPGLVLADYFDLIAGTSTGGIIAAALSSGMSVEEIRDFYHGHNKEMFDHAHWWKAADHKYNGAHLKSLLQHVFGKETRLGTEKLKTLLMLVMRNVSTDQPWIVTNNPGCRFNDPGRPDCQLNLPLWQLIRASTAAPGFFPPETIKVGEHEFVFVDGSVSSFTNPAFHAFLRATAKPFDIHWPAGENNLLVVSVGTGIVAHARNEIRSENFGMLDAAISVPSSLILSTVLEQDLLCRIFGKCLNGHQLDQDVGDLVGMEAFGGGEHLFTYARYNANIDRTGLNELCLPHIHIEDIRRIDDVEHVSELVEIGQAIAHSQVRPEHFSGFLNLE